MTGRPEPDVNWLKDGQTVDPAAPMNRTDAGRYTVSAESASFVRRELTVHVLCACQHKPDHEDILHKYTKV